MSAAALALPGSGRGWRRLLDAGLLAAGLLVAWQLLHEWAGDTALTSPVETIRHMLALFDTPTTSRRFWPHLFETLRALGLALVIAYVAGVAIGVTLGIHKLSGEVAEPLVVAVYSLPKVTLYPLVLLIFGLGLPAKVAFGAIHGVAPVVIFALGAIRAIKPVHLKTARVLRLTPMQAFRTVWLPAALPEIVSGLRVGFSLTLLGVMIGEMFASQRGLGFLVMNAIGLNDVRQIMAVTLMIALFAITVNVALLAIDRRLKARS